MISVRISYWTGATINVDGMMVSLMFPGEGEESWSLDNASALQFLDPGL